MGGGAASPVDSKCWLFKPQDCAVLLVYIYQDREDMLIISLLRRNPISFFVFAPRHIPESLPFRSARIGGLLFRTLLFPLIPFLIYRVPILQNASSENIVILRF